ncbi:MAG: hypothetical protein JWO36_919 [Myxococcales bacterium]|nr:hypothetical protein [Myxococcales bacterium]
MTVVTGIAIALVCTAGVCHADEAPAPAPHEVVKKPAPHKVVKKPAAKRRPNAQAKKTVAHKNATDHGVSKTKTDPERASTQAHMVKTTDVEATPAYRYGSLSKDACEAELTTRKIAFTPEPSPVPGVLAPVRIEGPLHGVEFRGDLAEKARAESPYEIADCRLVLSLDDFAEILTTHGIVEVRHYSMYRPPAKDWPADKLGTRHNGALALDAGRFIDKAGKVLDVTKDFNGAIDAKTCGEGATPNPVTPEATELRAILCEAVDRRLFNVVLTPNYNKPHKNHFHLEITAGVKWFLVH